jgi:hypothetical protein
MRYVICKGDVTLQGLEASVPSAPLSRDAGISPPASTVFLFPSNCLQIPTLPRSNHPPSTSTPHRLINHLLNPRRRASYRPLLCLHLNIASFPAAALQLTDATRPPSIAVHPNSQPITSCRAHLRTCCLPSARLRARQTCLLSCIRTLHRMPTQCDSMLLGVLRTLILPTRLRWLAHRRVALPHPRWIP